MGERKALVESINEVHLEIARGLAQWATDQHQLSRRYDEEEWELDEQRDELLLRAHEAGMTYSQIARALSSEGDLRYYAQTATGTVSCATAGS